MKKIVLIYLFCITISLTFCYLLAFSQEATTNIEQNPFAVEEIEQLTQPSNQEEFIPEEAVKVEPEVPAPEETKWLWAEVTSIEPQANSLNVKYLDYDSDEEKVLTIIIDANTKLENLNSLEEIQAGDYVSVDYSLDSKKDAIAKNLTLQRAKAPGNIPEQEAPVSPTTP